MNSNSPIDPTAARMEPQAFCDALTAGMPLHVLDVRRLPAFDRSAHTLTGAMRSEPEDVAGWARDNEALKSERLVVFCVYGHEVGANATAQLRELGFNAFQLAGGIEGGEDGVDDAADIARWRMASLPKVAKP
jgi:rhodanese-related sulfurtransferase